MTKDKIIKKIYLESLGCARNQVDSELMLGQLKDNNFLISDDPAEAEIIVVNTCSFIESAINESIDTILELAKLKKNGNCRKLIVAGCLPERFREEIANALPEVDVFLGTGAFDKIVHIVLTAKDIPLSSKCYLPDPDVSLLQKAKQSRVRLLNHQAYIKIAEGCSRHCTYCIIPKLRGKHKSRPIEDIVEEARSLISSGVKEITLVAQDSTFYGKDFSPAIDLSLLLERLSQISEDIWIRVLYGHPESITKDTIETIAKHSNICSYFDIPIQHVSKKVLKKMGRSYDQEFLYQLFDQIRSKIPDAALRTTIILGFPGETEKDFDMLLNFLEKVCFDHLGAFTYSNSKDLPSNKLSGKVSKAIAEQRLDKLMTLQSNISLEINQKYLDKKRVVLIEEKSEDNLFIGRTIFQAPEVDGIIYVHGKELKTGSFIDVKVTDVLEYDLIGEA